MMAVSNLTTLFRPKKFPQKDRLRLPVKTEASRFLALTPQGQHLLLLTP
jgi:hypothetical protein